MEAWVNDLRHTQLWSNSSSADRSLVWSPATCLTSANQGQSFVAARKGARAYLRPFHTADQLSVVRQSGPTEVVWLCWTCRCCTSCVKLSSDNSVGGVRLSAKTDNLAGWDARVEIARWTSCCCFYFKVLLVIFIKLYFYIFIFIFILYIYILVIFVFIKL